MNDLNAQAATDIRQQSTQGAVTANCMLPCVGRNARGCPVRVFTFIAL